MWNLEILRQTFSVDAARTYDQPPIPQNVITGAYLRTALVAGMVFGIGKVLKIW